jgi:hypothetical protein
MRKHGFLVPFQQVEFYVQRPVTREAYYVRFPEWWGREAWVSRQIYDPIPPIITYLASRFLRKGGKDNPEARFWWLVFESEWTIMLLDVGAPTSRRGVCQAARGLM